MIYFHEFFKDFALMLDEANFALTRTVVYKSDKIFNFSSI